MKDKTNVQFNIITMLNSGEFQTKPRETFIFGMCDMNISRSNLVESIEYCCNTP